MLVEDIKDGELDGYLREIDKIFSERIDYFNKSFSDLYSGTMLFRYNIDEEVILDILKNQYGIDG